MPYVWVKFLDVEIIEDFARISRGERPLLKIRLSWFAFCNELPQSLPPPRRGCCCGNANQLVLSRSRLVLLSYTLLVYKVRFPPRVNSTSSWAKHEAYNLIYRSPRAFAKRTQVVKSSPYQRNLVWPSQLYVVNTDKAMKKFLRGWKIKTATYAWASLRKCWHSMRYDILNFNITGTDFSV